MPGRHSISIFLLTFLLATSAATEFAIERGVAIEADITFLADDMLEGRAPGERGHEIAARYVASRFAALGLQPAGDNGSWYQEVRLRASKLGPTGATLTLNGKPWESGRHVIIYPDFVEQRRELTAPLVFAGYGIDARDLGFDDYRGIDARDKIVVLLEGAPIGTPSEIGAHLARQKMRMAADQGAVGVITLATRTGRQLFPWKGRLLNEGGTRLTLVEPGIGPHLEAPGIRAMIAADPVAAEALFEGAPRTLNSILDEAEQPAGRPTGFALPAEARIRSSSVHRDFTSPNVIARLPGREGGVSDEAIVVMAHLDHLGKISDKVYNGALDNAAGVAIMLDVARRFAQQATAPHRTVLFLASTGEEEGLFGAEQFAARPPVPLDRVAGVVNLDMPMITYEFTDVIAFGAAHSTLQTSAEKAAKAGGVKLAADPMPAEGMFTRSDHYALVQKGIPAVFLTTGPGDGGVAAARSFLSNHYHRPSDTIAQPFDWRAAARFSRVAWLLAAEIADADARPCWFEGNFFGDAFAPTACRTPRSLKK